jgi:hypothetical protein
MGVSVHGATAIGRRRALGDALSCGAVHTAPDMIVSHRHQFIFAAIPKTGTHSVRMALREHLADDDLEQVGLFVDKKLPFAELAQLRHGHIGLAQIQPHLGAADFARYFKFAFVRNPFDRFVSYCAFITRDRGTFQEDPRRVMHRILFEMRPLHHVLFQPQNTLLCREDGQLLTDFIGRVETMQASYDQIASRIGIPTRTLDRINSSQRTDYRTYYDQRLIDGVSELYRRDLELFDYSF